MQVTGNSNPHDRILSIRLSSDGLYFWYAGREAQKAAFSGENPLEEEIASAVAYIKAAEPNLGAICYYEDTLKEVLVPDELFDDSLIDNYLAVNNIEVGEGEQVAVVGIAEGVKSLVVYNKAVADIVARGVEQELTVGSHFGQNIAALASNSGLACTLYLTPKNVYMTVVDAGALKYCDALRWNSREDVAFYLATLDKEFGLGKSPVYVAGHNAGETAKYLRKFFKGTVCV